MGSHIKTRDTGNAVGLQVKVTVQPVVEPMTLQEAKDYAKIETSKDDALVTELIQAARELTEELLNRKLITQTVKAFWKTYQEEMIVPYPPHQSVDTVTEIFEDETTLLVLDSDYFVNGLDELRVKLPFLFTDRSLEIVFKAGYGDASTDIPKAIKTGVLMIFANMYEHRQDIEKMAIIPLGARALLQRFIFLNV